MTTPTHEYTVFQPATSRAWEDIEAAYRTYAERVGTIEKGVWLGLIDEAEEAWLYQGILVKLEEIIIRNQLTAAGVAPRAMRPSE